ncbi:hypothetical protein Pelo_5000 [Pelomyxa schiedti]|nr:hypothetical protein Pelo_5000 [Pelomyxa schiedti]
MTSEQQRLDRLMLLSRVVWDHVVVPTWVERPSSDRSAEPAPGAARRDCVAVMRVAEAMFPLVPRACAAVLGAGGPLWLRHRGSSSYFALECAADAAGDPGERGRCAAWIITGHRGRTRGRGRGSRRDQGEKEGLAVLWGLCVGGHLATAKLFVDGVVGDNPATAGRRWWWEDCGVRWCEGGGGMGDDRDGWNLVVRDYREGHLGVAKWIVARFGVKEWELFFPFCVALWHGHLAVAQWLACHFDVEIAIDVLGGFKESIGYSGNLAVIKWYDDEIIMTEEDAVHVLSGLVEGNGTAEEQIEGCKLLAEQFSGLTLDTKYTQVCRQETLRWLINHGLLSPKETSPQCSPERFCLYCAYNHICDANLIEWLIDTFNVPLPECFDKVFQNSKDSVAVVKVMIQRAKSLPAKVTEDSITKALSVGNFAVADWLDDTYHFTQARGAPGGGGTKSLTLSCVAQYSESAEALKWFLHRVPHQLIGQNEVVEAVQECVRVPRNNIRGALYLLETFHIPREKATARMWKKVLKCLPNADLASAQKIAALGQFSHSEAAEFLPKKLPMCTSSKAVKWLIESFNLTRDQVTHNRNELLFELISNSKANCAEWLIRKFHITLQEVLFMAKRRLLSDYEGFTIFEWSNVDVRTWRMLLRQFPGLTAAIVTGNDNLMTVAVASPRNIELSVSRLGLALDVAVDLHQALCHESASETDLSRETDLWVAITQRDEVPTGCAQSRKKKS